MTVRDTYGDLVTLEELLGLFDCGEDGREREGVPAEEDTRIEDLIRRARQEVALGTTRSGASENDLLRSHAQRLVGLVALIARITPLKGSGSNLGFMHPRRWMACKLRGKTTADVSEQEFDQMQEMVEQTEALWEGEVTMQGLPLARNALLHAILSDEELREAAFQRAEETLGHCAEVSERSLLKPV